MKIKGLIETDLINFISPCMTIETNKCSFKCDKECGKPVCQNSDLAAAPDIDISINELILRYLNNPITQAIVFQGLEPFDSWDDVNDFIFTLRKTYNCEDYVIIYTGYTEEELHQKGLYPEYFNYKNIIIKFGRFIPNKPSRFEPLLGVELASDNQYAKEFS